jgi:hypothetical protein
MEQSLIKAFEDIHGNGSHTRFVQALHALQGQARGASDTFPGNLPDRVSKGKRTLAESQSVMAKFDAEAKMICKVVLKQPTIKPIPELSDKDMTCIMIEAYS